MKIHFWKMHGASNDFIMIDDRTETFPESDQAWISSIASRRTGVGCEGIILIQPSEAADFKMRFFNPDGTEVEMCGNGARCVSRLASDIGAARKQMSFETIAGILQATVTDESVVLEMTEPEDWKLGTALDINGEAVSCPSVNTGVPHAVVTVDDLKTVDVQTLGAAIRYHEAFAPAGTNANFVHVLGGNTLAIRTYERGVEGETLACGTGMVASALISARLGAVTPPVVMKPASGDTLSVDFDLSENGACNVTLSGPAEYVFEGILEYNG